VVEYPRHNGHVDYCTGAGDRSACLHRPQRRARRGRRRDVLMGIRDMTAFQLAVCAEMIWRDRPIDWRASRLKEMGFGVGLWNWPDHDLSKLEKTGASFTIMNGYLRGRLTDDEGAAELLMTARETAQVGKRLGVARLNLHGTGLGNDGLPVTPVEIVSGPMWLKAHDTLRHVVDMADKEGVTFTLENLNNAIDH